MSTGQVQDLSSAAWPARDLASAQAKVDAARAQLASLLQDLAQAEARLDGNQTAQLLEANEQLVFAALRNQNVAESATQALEEAKLSAELDLLTGLPNRVRLLDRYAQGVALARRHGGGRPCCSSISTTSSRSTTASATARATRCSSWSPSAWAVRCAMPTP